MTKTGRICIKYILEKFNFSRERYRMKKITAVFIAITFFIMISGPATSSDAKMVAQKIASEAVAKGLAAKAGGVYVSGAAAPTLTGTQVALPVVSEATNKIIGYVVAEKANLVAALNAAGYASVASAIAAAEAGSAAGFAVGSGISSGTIAVGVAIAAGVAALAVGAGGGGGGGGGGSTTPHH